MFEFVAAIRFTLDAKAKLCNPRGEGVLIRVDMFNIRFALRNGFARGKAEKFGDIDISLDTDVAVNAKANAVILRFASNPMVGLHESRILFAASGADIAVIVKDNGASRRVKVEGTASHNESP